MLLSQREKGESMRRIFYGVVHNGRIVLDEPAPEWPDGTIVYVRILEEGESRQLGMMQQSIRFRPSPLSEAPNGEPGFKKPNV